MNSSYIYFITLQYNNGYSSIDKDKVGLIILAFILIFIVVIIRNWFNLYKKRKYKKANKQLSLELNENQIKIEQTNKDLKELNELKRQLKTKHNEIFKLQSSLDDYKRKFNDTLNEKEQKIAKQKEELYNQKNAYERYVNFKNVEGNNTRLGAHFIKNVISQIYSDIELTDKTYKSFLGINYKVGKVKRILPLKALKNIFKLLDYNVAALNKEEIGIKEELEHISMFLDLIRYLKPNADIAIENCLKQNNTIKIKPTLFFPFVENALKHGSLNEDDSFIKITLKENKDKQLSYTLVNSAEQRIDQNNSVSQSSNFGLNTLQQLLNAYYPKSKLEHRPLPNNLYLSELTLNFN